MIDDWLMGCRHTELSPPFPLPFGLGLPGNRTKERCWKATDSGVFVGVIVGSSARESWVKRDVSSSKGSKYWVGAWVQGYSLFSL